MVDNKFVTYLACQEHSSTDYANFPSQVVQQTFNEDVVLTTLSAKEYELTIGRDNLSQPLVNSALVKI